MSFNISMETIKITHLRPNQVPIPLTSSSQCGGFDLGLHKRTPRLELLRPNFLHALLLNKSEVTPKYCDYNFWHVLAAT